MLILIEKAKQIHLSVSAELSLQINPTLPLLKKKGLSFSLAPSSRLSI